MMDRILQRTMQAYVAYGSGIPQSQVIAGQNEGGALDGLYATVTLRDERTPWLPEFKQRVEEDRSYTIIVQTMKSFFDVNFYRAGARDAARRFQLWAMSETGRTWAATALTCGRLSGVNVYQSGSGYEWNQAVIFPHDPDDFPGGNVARGRIITNDPTGRAIRISLDNGGSLYSTMPAVQVLGDSGTGMTAAPRGFGFVAENINYRNMTDIEGGEFEERAMVDLEVTHQRVYNDEESGRIEQNIGDYPRTEAFAMVGAEPVDGDRLMYIYQTNLVPSGATQTLAGSENDGIALRRLAEWGGITGSTGDTGIGEVTLLNVNPIVPQHGRDLIATSPFMASYEGAVAINFQLFTNNVNGFLGLAYIKTIHSLPSGNTITSVRAFSFPIVLSSGIHSVSVPLSAFNSMVMLANDIPSGGTIGIELRLGLSSPTNRTGAQVSEILQHLNAGTDVPDTIKPRENVGYSITGYNTRVTFLQFDLG